MKIVERDLIIAEKVKRRSEINQLKHSLNGDLLHVGKVSAGCHACFRRSQFSTHAFYIGAECNVKCGECYYSHSRTDASMGFPQQMAKNFADFYEKIYNEDFQIENVSYNSHGEPMMYMPALIQAGRLVREYEAVRGTRVFSHMYTNGMFATDENLEILRELHITELRFHLSASGWSDKVKRSMIKAKELGFVVSVEEGSLEYKREKLFEHLPWFEEIGLDHLDIVETQVTENNFRFLQNMHPNGRYYRDLLWHLYDEGLVYDVIEEVIRQGYSYSVIDCNSRNELARDAKHMSVPAVDALISDEMIYSAMRTFEESIGA